MKRISLLKIMAFGVLALVHTACENAKYVIMTHDDSHFENQEEIYLDMTKGLKYDNYEIVRDRKEGDW